MTTLYQTAVVASFGRETVVTTLSFGTFSVAAVGGVEKDRIDVSDALK